MVLVAALALAGAAWRGSSEEPPRRPLFLLFENSKAIADFDTKAVSKIDQKWRILTRMRSVKSNKIWLGWADLELCLGIAYSLSSVHLLQIGEKKGTHETPSN